jgi:hypothetical protein
LRKQYYTTTLVLIRYTMKTKNIQLYIASPCNQNWDEMTSTHTGKFCTHCTHNVLDFTHLSDAEIVKLVSQAKGKLCGRFTQDQLNRSLSVPAEKSVFYKLYSMVASLLLFTTIDTATAQSQTPQANTTIAPTNTDDITIVKDTSVAQKDTNKHLRGVVLDNNNEPVPFATVTIKNTVIHSQTDFDGNFKIIVSTLRDSVNLVVSCIGYKSNEFSIFSEENVILNLERSSFLTGDIVIIKGYVNPTQVSTPQPKRKKLFSRKDKE